MPALHSGLLPRNPIRGIDDTQVKKNHPQKKNPRITPEMLEEGFGEAFGQAVGIRIGHEYRS